MVHQAVVIRLILFLGPRKKSPPGFWRIGSVAWWFGSRTGGGGRCRSLFARGGTGRRTGRRGRGRILVRFCLVPGEPGHAVTIQVAANSEFDGSPLECVGKAAFVIVTRVGHPRVTTRIALGE